MLIIKWVRRNLSTRSNFNCNSIWIVSSSKPQLSRASRLTETSIFAILCKIFLKNNNHNTLSNETRVGEWEGIFSKFFITIVQEAAEPRDYAELNSWCTNFFICLLLDWDTNRVFRMQFLIATIHNSLSGASEFLVSSPRARSKSCLLKTETQSANPKKTISLFFV